jgi:hypothetical protein
MPCNAGSRPSSDSTAVAERLCAPGRADLVVMTPARDCAALPPKGQFQLLRPWLHTCLVKAYDRCTGCCADLVVREARGALAHDVAAAVQQAAPHLARLVPAPIAAIGAEHQ